MTVTTKLKDADDIWSDLGGKPKDIPTAAQVLKRQNERAEADRVNLPAQVQPASAVDDYLKDLGGPIGRIMKFNKDGRFTTGDGEEVAQDRNFAVIHDQIQVGYIKFGGKGEAPERRMGPLFNGYRPPPRSELGDLDQTQWDIGLNGQPQDPWQPQIQIPLADVMTEELYLFGTTSVTGRKACGNLIAQAQRMARNDPDNYLVVALRTGGFNHAKFGRVKTPSFLVRGKVPKSGAASKSDEMNDSVDNI
jgi:hypothetical protein